MKLFHLVLSICLLAPLASRADIQADWAFHAVDHESRLTEQVPGESYSFLSNGTDQIPNADTVTLYVLTAHDFAGEMDEQIYVRWWDGAMSHWVMGGWVKNIELDASMPESCLRGLPEEGTVSLDLWRIDIPASITQPGHNFYAIQLKGFSPTGSEERYLLSMPGGDFTQINNVGQIWSASEEFDGQDWRVNILQ